MPVPAVAPFVMKEVSLMIGADEYNCAVRAVTLTPTTNIVEWESLCEDGSGQEAGKTTWSLDIEYYQDWQVDSFADHLATNIGEQAVIKFNPHGDTVGPTNPTFTVNVFLVGGAVGGTVNEFATATVSLPVIGQPTYARV
jgi:hypothetical protein